MNILFFDFHTFEKAAFETENKNFKHNLKFLDSRLTPETASEAKDYECICVFVNDQLNRKVLETLAKGKTKLIALRSAGFNHVDLEAANQLELRVVRVPEYSPHAIAEYAVALILSLNRKINRAYNRVREGNFSLDGLVGFDLYQKKVGILGTGRIGSIIAKILLGFGCEVLAYDERKNEELATVGIKYYSLEEILQKSDIISLHLPLTPNTHHILNADALQMTKPGVMIINTGRGALIDTHALIANLKSGHVSAAGLDVYEEEEAVFFKNLSDLVLQDDQLARLLMFPNVLLTSHQAFLTREALHNIAHTTLENICEFEKSQSTNQFIKLKNEV